MAQSPKPASTQTPPPSGVRRSLPSAPPTADLRISTPISQVHWFTGMRRQNSGQHLTCIYWVIKEATQEGPTGREAWGGVWGAGGFHLLSGTPPSRHLPVFSGVQRLGTPRTPFFRSLYGGLITRAWPSGSCAVGDGRIGPGDCAGPESSNPPIMPCSFWGPGPVLDVWGPTKKHLISTDSGVDERRLLQKTKWQNVLRSLRKLRGF